MKIIITESQLKLIEEQKISDSFLSTSTGANVLIRNVLNQYGKFSNFVDVIRPEIERRGMKLFPANERAKNDPNFKNTPEYRELKDKEDAYDHQLASAVAASMFGPLFSEILGKTNEIKGGLRMFTKGSPSKGIGKFEKFTSGWEEDNANNSIGIEIGKKYPNKDIDFLSNLVVKNIESKNYYDSSGKKKI